VIALLITTSIIAGAFLGWFGYRASLRIQAWGLNMNAQDRIFQEAIREDGVDPASSRKRPGAESVPVAALGSQLPLRAASSK
jgi:hypothetical protein